jgi:2-polyprenyl-3-methyl-5-hydroxy-6-metoxy-1,4-benzoquinol methylase
MLELFKKGIKNPKRIPPFLLAKVLPASMLHRAQTHTVRYKKEDGFATFVQGGFAGGTSDRIEFAARNYYEISTLIDIINEHCRDVNQSIEIGCGYGRLSPWIAELSDHHVGLDANREVISRAEELYPDIEWVPERIQDYPAPDVGFDLVVTWTVLQHVPPESIEETVKQIQDLLNENGTVIICEETKRAAGEVTWPRSIQQYDTLFERLRLVDTWERILEPTYQGHAGNILLFKPE